MYMEGRILGIFYFILLYKGEGGKPLYNKDGVKSLQILSIFSLIAKKEKIFFSNMINLKCNIIKAHLLYN